MDNEKIARELVAIANELTDAVEMLRMEFPAHETVFFLDDVYRSHAAYNYEKMTTDVVLKAFRRAYKPWAEYLKLLEREARQDHRLREALQISEKADKLFKILESEPLSEWQSGFVTLLARLKRSHEAIYNVR